MATLGSHWMMILLSGMLELKGFKYGSFIYLASTKELKQKIKNNYYSFIV